MILKCFIIGRKTKKFEQIVWLFNIQKTIRFK